MPITTEQRESRKKYVGSSDIAAICGADEYRNASDLWLEKTGRLVPEVDSSEEAELGNDLEEAALQMCQRRLRERSSRNILSPKQEIIVARGLPTLYDANDIFCANLDGAILENGVAETIEEDFELRWLAGKIAVTAVVEAKTTMLRERWGDKVEDVPLNVMTQAHWQMMLAHCDVTWVPVFFPGGYRKVVHPEVYKVERNEDLVLKMRETAERFWQYVLDDTPPPADFSTVAHYETLKRVRREPKSVVKLSAETEQAWAAMAALKTRKSHLETDIELFYRQIVAALGDAEMGNLENGDSLTYYDQNGQRTLERELLQVELNNIATGLRATSISRERLDHYATRLDGALEAFTRQGRHRTLRYSKNKVLRKRK